MKKSFTLIEILVVATIIGLLTASATVAYSQFAKQSRDARRQSDLQSIRAALEIGAVDGHRGETGTAGGLRRRFAHRDAPAVKPAAIGGCIIEDVQRPGAAGIFAIIPSQAIV